MLHFIDYGLAGVSRCYGIRATIGAALRRPNSVHNLLGGFYDALLPNPEPSAGPTTPQDLDPDAGRGFSASSLSQSEGRSPTHFPPSQLFAFPDYLPYIFRGGISHALISPLQLTIDRSYTYITIYLMRIPENRTNYQLN